MKTVFMVWYLLVGFNDPKIIGQYKSSDACQEASKEVKKQFYSSITLWCVPSEEEIP